MPTRRGLFKKTLGGAALLALASAVPVALRRTRVRAPPAGRKLQFFTPEEYSIFAAVADRVLAIPEANAAEPLRRAPTPAEVDVAGKADAFLAPLPADDAKQLKQLLGLFDNALFSVLTLRAPTPFTQKSPEEQDAQLRDWSTSRLAVRRTGYQVMRRLCSALYYGSPETWASADYRGPPDVSAVRAALKAAEEKSAAEARK
jgi:hypothetical protein